MVATRRGRSGQVVFPFIVMVCGIVALLIAVAGFITLFHDVFRLGAEAASLREMGSKDWRGVLTSAKTALALRGLGYFFLLVTSLAISVLGFRALVGGVMYHSLDVMRPHRLGGILWLCVAIGVVVVLFGRRETPPQVRAEPQVSHTRSGATKPVEHTVRPTTVVVPRRGRPDSLTSELSAMRKAFSERELLVTNSIGITFRYIERGRCLCEMQRNDFLDAEEDEDTPLGPAPHKEAVREIIVEKPLYLAVCEVTQEQYKHVMGLNPSRFQDNPDRPVDSVSWYDAADFCIRLQALEQGTMRYRLPTEEEWEFACRAGAAGGSPAERSPEAFVDYGWCSANSENASHAVGQKAPNTWGLCDMHGNVSEWCRGGFDDPHMRAVRGGSWALEPAQCGAAAHNIVEASSATDTRGFRVAASAP